VGLQNALAEATSRADEAVAQIQTEALEKERATNSELRETLERVKTEFSLFEDSSKIEIKELKDRLEKEQRSSKLLKDELTSEITVNPHPSYPCSPDCFIRYFPLIHSGAMNVVKILESGIETRSPAISSRRIKYIL